MKDVVAINGKVFAPQDAMVSVFDRGFLYGDSVYEVARSYHHIFFALEDHIERLFRSAKRIGLEIGLTPADLIKEIYKVYEQSGLEDAYMRIVVSRGEGPINLDPTNFTHPNIVIIIKALEPAQVSLYSTGMKVVTSTFLRNAKEALDPNIKSGNYLNNILALGEAKKKKADDALLVNREGFVTEGTT
jgi:branched-chain amino acid aminotransferase